MGLDALLATLESRAADTPDTPCNPLEVSAKPASLLGCTPDTPATPINDNATSETAPADRPASPWRALYREWFAGFTEPTAVVTLDPTQKRQAVDAGVVSLELARESVLVAYRGPDAQGLLAVQREKYDAFKLIEALEGTP